MLATLAGNTFTGKAMSSNGSKQLLSPLHEHSIWFGQDMVHRNKPMLSASEAARAGLTPACRLVARSLVVTTRVHAPPQPFVLYWDPLYIVNWEATGWTPAGATPVLCCSLRVGPPLGLEAQGDVMALLNGAHPDGVSSPTRLIPVAR